MDLPDTIEAVRPCVAQVSATVFGLPEEELARYGTKSVLSRPLGTAFVVSSDALVVTARHVLEAARALPGQFPNGSVHVGIGLAYPNSENVRGNFNVVGYEVLEEDSRNDLALLRMDRNPLSGELITGISINDVPLEPLFGVARLRPERPRDGEPIAISGYPLGEPVLLTNAGIVASSWSVTVEHVADPSFPGVTIPELRDTYLGDVQSNPGNSGGPVYASDGSVIGVLVAGKLAPVIGGDQPAVVDGVQLSADAGLSVIVPVQKVVDMLDKQGAEWVPPKDLSKRVGGQGVGKPTP